jgi:succinate dehydrogenase/fumarate reductase flavoprotein subunit
MATAVPGLLVAGEVVGGANGANRLSGNALTEAFVFGRRAGRSAAERAKHKVRPMLRPQDAAAALDLVRADGGESGRANTAEMIARLQATMADNVGPIRTGAKLTRALGDLAALAAELGEVPPGRAGAFDLQRLEWFDLRNMLVVAQAVADAALRRTESRGAHQREDFSEMVPHWQVHQTVLWRDGRLQVSGAPADVPDATSATKALAS